MDLVQAIDRNYYPQFEPNLDDYFSLEKLMSFIHPEAKEVEFWAGAGIVEA